MHVGAAASARRWPGHLREPEPGWGLENVVLNLWVLCRGNGPEGTAGACRQPLLPHGVRDPAGGNLGAGSYPTGIFYELPPILSGC